MEKNTYVLVTCVPGKEDKTQNFLNKIPQIKNSIVVKGAFDIVIKMKTSSMNEFRGLLWSIRNLSTVRSTLTLNVHD